MRLRRKSNKRICLGDERISSTGMSKGKIRGHTIKETVSLRARVEGMSDTIGMSKLKIINIIFMILIN